MREVDGPPAVSGCRATAVSENHAAAAGTQHQSMIRKSGYRFSEKIVLKQKDRAG